MNFNFLKISEILNSPIDLNQEGIKIEKSELEGQFGFILLQVLSNILNNPTTLSHEISTYHIQVREVPNVQIENPDGNVENLDDLSIPTNFENAYLSKVDLGLWALKVKTEKADTEANFKPGNLKLFAPLPLNRSVNVELEGSSSNVEILKSSILLQRVHHLSSGSEIASKFSQRGNELTEHAYGDEIIQVVRVSEEGSRERNVETKVDLSDVGFKPMRKLSKEIDFEFVGFERADEKKINVRDTEANPQIKGEHARSNEQDLFSGEYEKFKGDFEILPAKLSSQTKFVVKDFVLDDSRVVRNLGGEELRVVYDGVRVQEVDDFVREFVLSGKNLEKGELVLKLEPKELGEVVVKISQGEKGVNILFEVKNFEVKQVIESSIGNLKTMLELSNVKLERVGVMFDGLNSGDGRREQLFKRGNNRRKDFEYVGWVKIYGSSSIEAVI